MKLRRPIAVGADWALVRLESGEYLCVDTSTFEALGYILGWEHEADVIRVFRTFLTQRSVVLDIGANFGLYTALCASIVRNHGRLYAFEGNPRVFESLQRTIVANDLYFNPEHRCRKFAGLRRKRPRAAPLFGQAAIRGHDVRCGACPAAMRHTVEVEMTTIDDFLPPDLPVDLVKIDVEGHEPLVLRGMERTIERSPNIRIIMEFADNLLAHTLNPADFIDYIRSLGFAICRVAPGYKISLVPAGETLTGFNYCLLTRTPEDGYPGCPCSPEFPAYTPKALAPPPCAALGPLPPHLGALVARQPVTRDGKRPLDPLSAALLGNVLRTGCSGSLLPTGNPTESEIRDWCVKYLARTLDLPDHSIDPDMKFAGLGLDSGELGLFDRRAGRLAWIGAHARFGVRASDDRRSRSLPGRAHCG